MVKCNNKCKNLDIIFITLIIIFSCFIIMYWGYFIYKAIWQSKHIREEEEKYTSEEEESKIEILEWAKKMPKNIREMLRSEIEKNPDDPNIIALLKTDKEKKKIYYETSSDTESSKLETESSKLETESSKSESVKIYNLP